MSPFSFISYIHFYTQIKCSPLIHINIRPFIEYNHTIFYLYFIACVCECACIPPQSTGQEVRRNNFKPYVVTNIGSHTKANSFGQ